jgi:hypothetical protein
VLCCPLHSTPPQRKLHLKECRLVLKPQTHVSCNHHNTHRRPRSPKPKSRFAECEKRKTTKIKARKVWGDGRWEHRPHSEKTEPRAGVSNSRCNWACNCPLRCGSLFVEMQQMFGSFPSRRETTIANILFCRRG